MDFTVVRLLFDFGLLILIWVVQLIIYPGFKHFQKKNLIKWHSVYVSRIGLIVMPLMIGQFLMNIAFIFEPFNYYNLISLVFIVLVWISTFSQFVPIHSRISGGNFDSKLINQLIHLNWLRTFLWTIIFLCSLFQYLADVVYN